MPQPLPIVPSNCSGSRSMIPATIPAAGCVSCVASTKISPTSFAATMSSAPTPKNSSTTSSPSTTPLGWASEFDKPAARQVCLRKCVLAGEREARSRQIQAVGIGKNPPDRNPTQSARSLLRRLRTGLRASESLLSRPTRSQHWRHIGLLGANATRADNWVIRGVGGRPRVPENVIDVGNSGTTLYVALASAALAVALRCSPAIDQIRRRPAQPLIRRRLNALGRESSNRRAETACRRFIVRGPMRGGKIKLDCGPDLAVSDQLLL